MIISFLLNGSRTEIDTQPHRRAVDLLREDFQLRSLRQNCGDSRCGTCLILLDNLPVVSCMLPAFELREKEVWTMEGLSGLKEFSDIVTGYKSAHVQLCDGCAAARALSTEALLRTTIRPSMEQAVEAAESVICACSSSTRIIDAILRSARLRERRMHAK